MPTMHAGCMCHDDHTLAKLTEEFCNIQPAGQQLCSRVVNLQMPAVYHVCSKGVLDLLNELRHIRGMMQQPSAGH